MFPWPHIQPGRAKGKPEHGRLGCAVNGRLPRFFQRPLAGETPAGRTAETAVLLINQSLFDSAVGVDASIAQERPMRPDNVDLIPVDLGGHDFFPVGAAFRDDFTAWRDDKALAPKLDPVAAGRRFLTDAIDRSDITTVRDRMTALHRFPCGILGRAVLFLFARMPADRGWIKQNLRAAQGRKARRFRVPLVPADADADLAVSRRPRLEPKVARREIEFLVVGRIVRDMHLAILPEVLTIGVDDRGSVVVNAGRALLEKRRDNDDATFARDFLQLGRRRPGNFFREREIRVVFALAEVLRTK